MLHICWLVISRAQPFVMYCYSNCTCLFSWITITPWGVHDYCLFKVLICKLYFLFFSFLFFSFLFFSLLFFAFLFFSFLDSPSLPCSLISLSLGLVLFRGRSSLSRMRVRSRSGCVRKVSLSLLPARWFSTLQGVLLWDFISQCIVLFLFSVFSPNLLPHIAISIWALVVSQAWLSNILPGSF